MDKSARAYASSLAQGIPPRPRSSRSAMRAFLVQRFGNTLPQGRRRHPAYELLLPDEDGKCFGQRFRCRFGRSSTCEGGSRWSPRRLRRYRPSLAVPRVIRSPASVFNLCFTFARFISLGRFRLRRQIDVFLRSSKVDMTSSPSSSSFATNGRMLLLFFPFPSLYPYPSPSSDPFALPLPLSFVLSFYIASCTFHWSSVPRFTPRSPLSASVAWLDIARTALDA